MQDYQEIFSSGPRGKDYNKVIDGMAILKNNDLMIAIQACPELKAFVNRIISLCDEEKIISWRKTRSMLITRIIKEVGYLGGLFF